MSERGVTPVHATPNASSPPSPSSPCSPSAILYNGHAGLGSNAAVTDGTSNTLQIGALILMADMGGQ